MAGPIKPKHRDTPLSMTPDMGDRQAYGKDNARIAPLAKLPVVTRNKPKTAPDTRTPEVRKIDSILNANKDKEWVRRLYDKNPESIQVKGETGRSTHLMASGDGKVFPMVDRDPKTKKLVYMGDTSARHHFKNRSVISLKDDKEAQWFGENYKKGTGVLKGKLKR